MFTQFPTPDIVVGKFTQGKELSFFWKLTANPVSAFAVEFHKQRLTPFDLTWLVHREDRPPKPSQRKGLIFATNSGKQVDIEEVFSKFQLKVIWNPAAHVPPRELHVNCRCKHGWSTGDWVPYWFSSLWMNFLPSALTAGQDLPSSLWPILTFGVKSNNPERSLEVLLFFICNWWESTVVANRKKTDWFGMFHSVMVHPET